MTDYYTDSTIVKGIISSHIKEGILQNTCGKTDLVGCWIIVSIHSLWCHVPIVAIHGLTYCMLNVVSIPELSASLHVIVKRFSRINLQLREVGPLIRITHLYIECIQLQQGINLSTIVHPILGSNTLTKSNLQVLNQSQHTLLSSLGEVLLGINLTKSLTHHALYLTSATLPQRMILLATSLNLTIEIKALSCSSIVQIVSRTLNKAPLQHVAILSRLQGTYYLVSTFQEVGLTNNHLLQELSVDALSVHHLNQRQVRILSLELLQSHLVVVSLRIAQLGTTLTNLSKCSLNLHNVLHLLGSSALAETKQLEHFYHVLLESLANTGCSLIVIQVVLLLTECQATLINTQNVLCGVLLVGTEASIEELLLAIRSLLKLDSQQLLNTFSSLKFLNKWHNRSYTFLITTCRVHSQLIKIAQFLLDSTLSISVALQLLQDTVNAFVVVFLQTVETTIARISCWQWVVLHPTTTGILIEVVTRTHILVKVGLVQA